jgi:hypothetical protein
MKTKKMIIEEIIFNLIAIFMTMFIVIGMIVSFIQPLPTL